jgi:hypothetical protein
VHELCVKTRVAVSNAAEFRTRQCFEGGVCVCVILAGRTGDAIMCLGSLAAMRVLAALLAISGSICAAREMEQSWTFDSVGRIFTLSDPVLEKPPLRLACTPEGYLEISILPTDETLIEISLVRPSLLTLVIRGTLRSDGRIISNVDFKSLTAEFFREEGEVEVHGGHYYHLHLKGARRVLDYLRNSCTAVS